MAGGGGAVEAPMGDPQGCPLGPPKALRGLRGAPLEGPGGPLKSPVPISEFGVGQIISMQLKGFMAFKSPVQIFFSPYTNLIASCNGVGKSTIVSAMHFALGIRSTRSSSSSSSAAAATARAASQPQQQQQQQQQQQLLRFLTYGGQRAFVCLWLKGKGKNEIVSIQRDLEKVKIFKK
ncbi:hypothetical protein, conserved [Eimeria tenella]|uniref:Rad50/SbcC-type AAA domain-containing protein n=1 Tax=Eimeria tenella TaxID=5802 RepID=U6L927_EIMTE|nr:hypothetical protein, conserved [Eimeria tenella]CDJ44295.1 hypothetical protein, conserved [Eimeria tenella]|eukprot:XP_013235044.1 hypothetical protein, conserved [Eimeria tenella]